MNKLMKFLLLVCALVMSAVPAFALPPTMADIFAAADMSTLATNVTVILVSFVGVNLLFLGARYLRKTGIRA